MLAGLFTKTMHSISIQSLFERKMWNFVLKLWQVAAFLTEGCREFQRAAPLYEILVLTRSIRGRKNI